MTFEQILKRINKHTIDVVDCSDKGLFDGGQQFKDISVVDLGNDNCIEFTIEVDRKFNSLHYNDAPSEEITIRNEEIVEIVAFELDDILILSRDQEKEIEAKIKSVLILN